MPSWFAAYMKSKEKDFERDEAQEEQLVRTQEYTYFILLRMTD